MRYINLDDDSKTSCFSSEKQSGSIWLLDPLTKARKAE